MGKRRLGIVLTAMLVAVGCSDAGVDSTPTATAPRSSPASVPASWPYRLQPWHWHRSWLPTHNCGC